MLDSQMDGAVEWFVNSIKSTETYGRYRSQLEKIKEDPELYEKINEFRRRNYEMQNTTGVDELFEKMEAFEREYEKFRENPMVNDFLRAELAFCRLMQEIDIAIADELDFEEFISQDP